MISKESKSPDSSFCSQREGKKKTATCLCNDSQVKHVRPFVKWAGGKNQLIEALNLRSPSKFHTYYEPFLGGGAFFFRLYSSRTPFKAVLSDTNEELVTAYLTIKNSVNDLILNLAGHQEKYHLSPREYYYEVRDFQEPKDNIERTSRFLFLNKTCYNGLYRVNREGKFNVPFGAYKRPNICDEQNLCAVSEALKSSSVELRVADYEQAICNAQENDFLYFDPPYLPSSSTANFTAYTSLGFTLKDQQRLANVFRKLNRKKCKIMMSNSDVAEIRQLYSGFQIETIQSLRAISCLGNGRRGHTDLIIRNYSNQN
jgi:DNA adenine methylase